MLISGSLSSIATVSSYASSASINLAAEASIIIIIDNCNCKSNIDIYIDINTNNTLNKHHLIVNHYGSSKNTPLSRTTNEQPSRYVHTFTSTLSPSYSPSSSSSSASFSPVKRSSPASETRNDNAHGEHTDDSGVEERREIAEAEAVEETRTYDIFAQTTWTTSKKHEVSLNPTENIATMVLNPAALLMDSSSRLLSLPSNPSISSAIFASDTTNYVPTTTATTTTTTTTPSAAQLLHLVAPTTTTTITAAAATVISTTTASTMLPSPSTIGYSPTSSYSGFNATDPYATYADSRSSAIPVQIQILMCLLYGTLAFTAITSNMIVCYIVLSNQRMRTATNYFIVNLAVGDILMAALCIPFTFPANLIFNYWPFGLSLCVIVSYSQANSVFISAYTMVAISIDKYLAIMYPMRLRMPKIQAKIIILVIWSLALLTSLPTAILSKLSSPDYSPTTAPSSDASPYSQAQTLTTTSASTLTHNSSPSSLTPPISATISSFANADLMSLQLSTTTPATSLATTTTTTSTTTTAATISNQQQQQQQHQEKKYFCQESWTFWPPGKYYYSMALMILQFVLPLFVLVITYSRIVIVVWGKRVPGEEDNARDARMARSKRKMIKMVIFCVIAFALTWLPFNALIVIGDMHPDIWDNQNISYIWFITHYLAMCHTITNPLIYIWMNNRFRVGFKQALSDLCRPLRQLIVCICCCFCFFDSSGNYSSEKARRYLRVSCSLSCDQQQHHSQQQHQHQQQHARATQRTTTSSGGGSIQQIQNSARSPAAPLNPPEKPAPPVQQQAAAAGGSGRRLQRGVLRSPTVGTETSTCGLVVATGTADPSPLVGGAQVRTSKAEESSRRSLAVVVAGGEAQEGVASKQNHLLGAASRSRAEYKGTASLAGSIDQREAGESAGGGGGEQVSGSSSGLDGQQRRRSKEGEQNRWPKKTMNKQQDTGQSAAAITSSVDSQVVKNRRKKKHSHVISIQMTSTEYHKWQPVVAATSSSTTTGKTAGKMTRTTPIAQAADAAAAATDSICPQTKMHKGCKRKSRWTNKKRPMRDCSTCQLEKRVSEVAAPTRRPSDLMGTVFAPATSTGSPPGFVTDVRRSSQSTATTSVLTTTTSLAVSPLNSQLGQVANLDSSSASRLNSSHLSETPAPMSIDQPEVVANKTAVYGPDMNGETAAVESTGSGAHRHHTPPDQLGIGCKSTTSGSFSCSEQVVEQQANSPAHCHKHQSAGGGGGQAANGGGTGIGQATTCGASDSVMRRQDDQSLETDDDVCDVFQARSSSANNCSNNNNNLNRQRSATKTKSSSGSLEQLSDQFEENDDQADQDSNADDNQESGDEVDDEGVRVVDNDEDGEEADDAETNSLEAEYGERSPRNQVLEMVKMSSSTRVANQQQQLASSRPSTLANHSRVEDDLNRDQRLVVDGATTPESWPPLGSAELEWRQHKCCTGAVAHHLISMSSSTARERSLRKAMLRNNHLLSSASAPHKTATVVCDHHHHRQHLLEEQPQPPRSGLRKVVVCGRQEAAAAAAAFGCAGGATLEASKELTRPAGAQVHCNGAHDNQSSSAAGSITSANSQQQQQQPANCCDGLAANAFDHTSTCRTEPPPNGAQVRAPRDPQQPQHQRLQQNLSASLQTGVNELSSSDNAIIDESLSSLVAVDNSAPSLHISNNAATTNEAHYTLKPMDGTVISGAQSRAEQPLRQAHSTTALLVRKVPTVYLINESAHQRTKQFAANGRAGGSLV